MYLHREPEIVTSLLNRPSGRDSASLHPWKISNIKYILLINLYDHLLPTNIY